MANFRSVRFASSTSVRLSSSSSFLLSLFNALYANVSSTLRYAEFINGATFSSATEIDHTKLCSRITIILRTIFAGLQHFFYWMRKHFQRDLQVKSLVLEVLAGRIYNWNIEKYAITHYKLLFLITPNTMMLVVDRKIITFSKYKESVSQLAKNYLLISVSKFFLLVHRLLAGNWWTTFRQIFRCNVINGKKFSHRPSVFSLIIYLPIQMNHFFLFLPVVSASNCSLICNWTTSATYAYEVCTYPEAFPEH